MSILVLTAKHPHGPKSIPFYGTIKLLDYNGINVIVTTTNNEIYQFDIGEMNFNKIDNPSLHCPITHLFCTRDSTYIINEVNEFFMKELQDESEDESKKFEKLENFIIKEKIKFTRSGYNFLFIVTNDFVVYSYGDNDCGQLGSCVNERNSIPIKIKNNFQVKDLRCGMNHTILLDIFGNVYTTGGNGYGQLGLGDNENRWEFTKVELNFKVIKVFADNLISFIVNEFNELYGTGFNLEGQLGINHLGTNTHVNTFVKIVNDNFKLDNYNFWFSHNDCTFISDNFNNIYVSGGNYSSGTLKYLNISVSNADSDLSNFVKTDILKEKLKYLQIVPLEDLTMIILSDYKINSEGKENLIGLKYLQRANNNQLVDVNIYCKDL